MELSPVVATIVPLSGIAVAIVLGVSAAEEERSSFLGTAFFISFALGCGLVLVQVLLHGLCIDALHLCKSRGDGNMTYWFQSFFAIPIFWLVAVATWFLKK